MFSLPSGACRLLIPYTVQNLLRIAGRHGLAYVFTTQTLSTLRVDLPSQSQYVAHYKAVVDVLIAWCWGRGNCKRKHASKWINSRFLHSVRVGNKSVLMVSKCFVSKEKLSCNNAGV